MELEAVAFDLDDTLLRDDRTISGRTLAVLRRAAAQGVRILPASGRALDSMWPFVEQMGCANALISCNGAEIWDARRNLLVRREFPGADAEEIVAFARARGSYAQTYAGAHFYYLIENHFAADYAASSMLTGFYTPELEAFLAAHPSSKILMMDEPEKIARMLAEAREQFAGRASVTCSKPYFLEFNPPLATKGIALAACAERLGFSLEKTAAFGDSLNDLSMLESAGIGVAVANAREDVRARVGRVCGSNEEDGPARWIARALWGEEID